MKIPCKRCITFAVCKTKEEIICPMLSNYYLSNLKENENSSRYYWILSNVYNTKAYWVYKYRMYSHNNMIESVLPILRVFPILRSHIDMELFPFERTTI